jgi:uncharacterized protein
LVSPELQRVRPASGPAVQGLSAQGFSIDGTLFRAVLLTPERAVAWDPPGLAALGIADLAPILDLSPTPEFIILGTGAAMAFPPRALVAELEARDIGVEAMDSRAAARTWSVLRAEDRWIAAAIMAL